MSNTPLVSIIIPCYNAAPRLAACLRSCLAQTYATLEILFVDNHSTDNSIAIAQQIATTSPDLIQILHCPRQGANNARNYGFTQAHGDYIQWLDADDELEPNKIALQVAQLERDRAYDIAYGDWEWCFYQDGQFQYRLAFESPGMADRLLKFLVHHWHPPHSYLLRRQVAQRLQEVQAWYPDAPIGNDREYFTTAALLGYQFIWVPEAKVRYYTWSNTQLTRSTQYWVRAQAHRQVFERFREQAKTQPVHWFSGVHWFLLNQNWDVWKLALADLSQLGESCFWVQHRTLAVGMTLTPAEARIVLALNQLGGRYTLEDHAYRVLRFLWKQVAQQPDINATAVSGDLFRLVGLLPGATPVDLEREPMVSPNSVTAKRLALIDAVPLYAPMFPEVRLAILQLLDKLRVAGLLTQVTPQTLAPAGGVSTSSAGQTG